MSDGTVLSQYRGSLVLTYVDTRAHDREKGVHFRMQDGTDWTLKGLIDRYHIHYVPFWVYISPIGALLGSDGRGNTTAREMLRDLAAILAKR